MGSYYIGLDPSLAAFGIAIIDTMTQTIILDQMRADDHHDFILMCWSIANLWQDFESKYKYYIDSEDTHIAQEAPIASGINSGKLNALGLEFYLKCGASSSYERIRTYQPIKLKQFHTKRGIKKYTKKDTIEVVENILEYLKEVGYNIDIRFSRTKRGTSITDGEADAFMYAIKTYIDKRPEAKTTRDILEMYPTLEYIQSLEEIKYGR
jgi:hypothetical protein